MIAACIICNENSIDRDQVLSRAMDVHGYSHCSSIRHDWDGTDVREVYYKRRGTVSVDSDLRKQKVYARYVRIVDSNHRKVVRYGRST